MVKVYSRTTCAPCQTLKYWLDKNNIEYTVIDVDENPEEYAKLGVAMVPATEVNGHIVMGLNYAAIKGHLEEP